jgi:hypothetical protein
MLGLMGQMPMLRRGNLDNRKFRSKLIADLELAN